MSLKIRNSVKKIARPIIILYSFIISLGSNVAFSCRRACGRLGTYLRLCPLNGSPLASVIGQLQRLVRGRFYIRFSIFLNLGAKIFERPFNKVLRYHEGRAYKHALKSAE